MRHWCHATLMQPSRPACRSHVPQMQESWLCHVVQNNVVGHKHECFISHMWRRHAAHMNEAYEWGMSRISMRRVTCMNESCHKKWLSQVTYMNAWSWQGTQTWRIHVPESHTHTPIGYVTILTAGEASTRMQQPSIATRHASWCSQHATWCNMWASIHSLRLLIYRLMVLWCIQEERPRQSRKALPSPTAHDMPEDKRTYGSALESNRQSKTYLPSPTAHAALPFTFLLYTLCWQQSVDAILQQSAIRQQSAILQQSVDAILLTRPHHARASAIYQQILHAPLPLTLLLLHTCPIFWMELIGNSTWHTRHSSCVLVEGCSCDVGAGVMVWFGASCLLVCSAPPRVAYVFEDVRLWNCAPHTEAGTSREILAPSLLRLCLFVSKHVSRGGARDTCVLRCCEGVLSLPRRAP